MRGILWFGGIFIVLFLLTGFLAPVMLRSKRTPNRTWAISNLKQVNLALIDFDADYGRYPDDSTIADVRANTGTTLALGTATSNDYFRQLIACGNHSEGIYWAPNPAYPRKPNNFLGTNALAKGECSFTYIPGLSTSGDPLTPVAMNPVRPGTLTFDPKPFDGKAVVLRIDGSVMPETIRPDGRVMLKGGVGLFDPGQPWWNGKTPDVKWPE